MATTDEVYLGNYDVNYRKQAVVDTLKQSFASFRKKYGEPEEVKEKTWFSFSSLWAGGSKDFSKKSDATMLKIMDIINSVQVTGQSVKEYKGPHFVQQYRILMEECAQHQLSLDDISQNVEMFTEEHRSLKKKALASVEDLIDQLSKKTHPDGQSCPDCELKDIKFKLN